MMLLMSMFFSVTSVQAASQSMAVKMLKPVIERQCITELKDSNVWKASTFLMTDHNKKQFEAEVCQCVGDNALNDVTVNEITQALLSEEAKNQLIRKATLNSIKNCVIKTKK
ncbi:hypothetical protein D7V64_11925 [Acinetobacter cumulans]|uniref:Uncharacterized protein n=2 Tax=Acinetobacter cumulans TaxID=2136182 RepID=A0A3A8FXS3_9GAMM|nr:hypothetical protein D7V64_11925 [Acinetobacter cumulans]